jgi:hypothetical protein
MRALVEAVCRLLGRLCARAEEEWLREAEEALDDALKKLEDWLRRAEGGQLGAERP